MTVFQSSEGQTVKLLRSGIDTVAVIPLKTLRTINKQLKETRKLKTKLIALNKKVTYSQYIISKRNTVIFKQQKEIFIKDSIINIQSIEIKQQGWDWLRAENRYEREKKKADKFKRFFISSLILSISIITLISLK